MSDESDAAKLLPCPLDNIQILGPNTIGGDPWFGFPQTHGTDNRECPWKDDSGAARLILWFRTWNEATAFSEALRNTRPPAPQEDGWRLIETLPENTLALLYAEYEPRICIGSFRWKEIVEDELISDHPNAKGGRRKVFQEKVTREREWDAENWGATHWRPLPSPPGERQREG